MNTAFIFPAFISDYLGNEIQILNSLSANFEDYLSEVSEVSGIDFSEFSIDNKIFTEDELCSQLISYTLSCCLADALALKNLTPDFLAGYSMGLYAALFAGGVIDFSDGVKLIKNAYRLSQTATADVESGMGSVVGLKEQEIHMIIEKNNLIAEIANTNNEHAYLVTGEKQSLNKLLEMAHQMGALNTFLLNVKTPYHSSALKNTREEFAEYIVQNFTFRPARYPIISSINQSILSSPEKIRIEIMKNLYQRIDWLRTFNKLRSLNVDIFIECGGGKSLQKIARFIPGDYRVFPMNKIHKLFQ